MNNATQGMRGTEMTSELERKLKYVTKSCKHVVRILTDSEAEFLIDKHNLDLEWGAEYGRYDDWFKHNESQVVLNRRVSGQFVIYTI